MAPADTRMAIARKALLFGPSRFMHSRSAAPNGHGRPPSKPGTEIGPDHEANKGPASKRGGAITAKGSAPYSIRKSRTNPRHRVVTADRYGFTVEATFAWSLRNELAQLARMSRRRASHPEEYRRKRLSSLSGSAQR
jgi:hypothetical protein